MFTGASCGMTMPFLRSSLWPFPMWTALPSPEYYGHSARADPLSGQCALPATSGRCCAGRAGAVPMFTVSRSSSEAAESPNSSTTAKAFWPGCSEQRDCTATTSREPRCLAARRD